jgi:hypothetical protein
MPRRAKGARLWLRKAQHDKSGKLTHAAIWIIKDGRHRESTGCCAEDYRQAEDRLADYIANKRLDHVRDGIRPPAAIPVADVLALYSRDLVDKQTRPKETTRRLKTLIDYFGDKVLSDINGNLCRQYAQDRVHQVAARRELEDLRAAINHHRKEGLCSAIVEIVLPPRPLHRDRWLTRQEAAHFIRTAWRYREMQQGRPTGRRSRQHIARFLLAAFYTVSRKQVVCSAALGPTVGRPWVDLKSGVFYRRPVGARETKKRRMAITVPPSLLAHLRRWKRQGQKHIVEFNGKPVGSIDKAFKATVRDAGFGPDVIPHTTRHTGITWLAIGGVDPYEICRYASITMETFEEVYAHHHPDFMTGVHKGFHRHRNRHRNAATDREQASSNVTKITGNSTGRA